VGLQLPSKRRETVQVDTGKIGLTYGKVTNNSKVGVVESALRETARAKRPAVVEMVKEAVDAKQKVVVFTYLREQCEAIARDVVWTNGSVFVANGDQTPEQRDVAAQGFRECGSPAVFVATIDSVGVAISLVGADLVIFADLSYDPSKLLQAEGRAHRIGSERPVLVRYVVAAGTLDESVAEIVVDKLDVIAATIGGMGDGGELASGLRKSELVTADVIVDRLFSRLIGG
jgi:SWI/SNF-related matrix-associated actin-dependent regulator 1 of chromatin subfamily A